MANTPSDPNEPLRDAPTTDTPRPKLPPGSLADSDWFAAIPELPVPPPERVPVIPTDADLDLDSIFSGASTSRTPGRDAAPSGWLTQAAPPSPSGDADGEDSDIFSVGRGRPRGGSDAFGLGDSADKPAPSPAGYSNVFDAPGASGDSGDLGRIFRGDSGDSGDPAGGTTSLDNPGDDLFLAFDHPPGGLFDDPIGQRLPDQSDDGGRAVNGLMDELHLPFVPPGVRRTARPGTPPAGPVTPNSGLDFNETAEGASSSNLFADLADLTEAEARSLNSGVDLLNPDGDLPPARRPGPAAGPDSSIFPKASQGSSLVNMDQIPLMGSSDDPTEAMAYTGADVDGTSSIFQHGDLPARPGAGSDPAGDRSSVSFGTPSRHGRIVSLGAGDAGAVSDDASAAIDWNLPHDLPAPRRPGPLSARGPAARPPDDGDADLSGLDSLDATARMAPSSGIFDVDRSRETPLGSLSGFYPSGASQGSKSGLLPAPASARHRLTPVPLPPPRSSTTRPVRAPAPSAPDVSPTPPRTTAAAKSGLSWKGGLALGLAAGLLGGGSVAALAFAAFGTETAAVNPRPTAPVTAAPPTVSAEAGLIQARTWLDAGRPDLALPAFEAAGDAAQPLDVAGRGQARWLLRVREAARAGQTLAVDDAGLKPALADLTRTVAAADTLTTPDERRAVVGAALRLGLTKELTGDADGAARDYQAAAAKYPEARKLFEVAATRVRLMQRPGKLSLAPRDIDGLLGVALAAVLLVQDAPAAGTEEPGVLFWDAANLAAAREYPAAIAALKKARALHDRTRLADAGRGPNPLSDPLGQIFLRCCDELAADWTLRNQLYTDPVAGPVFAKSGVAAGLTRLAAAAKPDPKVVAQLATAQAELKAKETELAAATAKGVEADDKLTAATAEATTAATAAKAAKDKLAAAEGKLTAAEDAVAKVVSGLKAGKVVGPDDDAATVVKNLPDILKKVTSASDSADAKKAAEKLTAARVEIDAARGAAAKADADAKALTAKLEAAQAESKKQAAAAQAELTQLRATVEADRKKAADEATQTARAELDAQKSAYESKLETMLRDSKRRDDNARAQIANARAGVSVPLMTIEVVAQGKAAESYTRAIDLYFGNRFAESEASLNASVEQDPADARYWYFLGLSRYAQGKPSASEAFKRGAEQEGRTSPASREVNAALEKVQGDARRELNRFRP